MRLRKRSAAQGLQGLKPLKEASWYGGVETPPFRLLAECYSIAEAFGAKELEIKLADAVIALRQR